jgi:putative FmdB family regulatory protein
LDWIPEAAVAVSEGFFAEKSQVPIYEYTCQGCRGEFELLLRGEETPQCPRCGGSELEKRFSVVAAHSASSRSLPVCDQPSRGDCGLPQCGLGGCQMM